MLAVVMKIYAVRKLMSHPKIDRCVIGNLCYNFVRSNAESLYRGPASEIHALHTKETRKLQHDRYLCNLMRLHER